MKTEDSVVITSRQLLPTPTRAVGGPTGFAEECGTTRSRPAHGASTLGPLEAATERTTTGMLPAGFEPTSEGFLGVVPDTSKALYP